MPYKDPANRMLATRRWRARKLAERRSKPGARFWRYWTLYHEGRAIADHVLAMTPGGAINRAPAGYPKQELTAVWANTNDHTSLLKCAFQGCRICAGQLLEMKAPDWPKELRPV